MSPLWYHTCIFCAPSCMAFCVALSSSSTISPIWLTLISSPLMRRVLATVSIPFVSSLTFSRRDCSEALSTASLPYSTDTLLVSEPMSKVRSYKISHKNKFMQYFWKPAQTIARVMKKVNTFNAECFPFQSFHWRPLNDIYSYVWTDHKIKHKWQLREKSCLLIVFNDVDTTWPSSSPDLTEFMRSTLSFPSWWHFSAKSKIQKYQCWRPPNI